jgi:hypothetical protein
MDGSAWLGMHGPITNAKSTFEGAAFQPLSSSDHERPEIHNLIKVDEDIIANHSHRVDTSSTILTEAHVGEVACLDRLSL